MPKFPSAIGPYTIQNELGRGGMSVVYRATDTRHGMVVALKVLPPELAHNDSLFKRFQRESAISTRLQHPNIVRTYETGEANGYGYVAMELASGGTLTDYLQNLRRKMRFEEIAIILQQVAAGIDYAHGVGLLHRDIKPSNIFFNAKGIALIADFGIAKDLFGDYSSYTGSGVVVGTPAYMSPEQAIGNGDLDQRSDIYSLGVVAYMLTTGRVPFEADSQPALLRKIAYDPLPAPEEINPQILPGTAFVLKTVLHKDPQKRYRSASQFAAAFAQSLMLTPDALAEVPSPNPGVLQRGTRPGFRRNAQRGGGVLTSFLFGLVGIGLIVAIWQLGAPILGIQSAPPTPDIIAAIEVTHTPSATPSAVIPATIEVLSNSMVVASVSTDQPTEDIVDPTFTPAATLTATPADTPTATATATSRPPTSTPAKPTSSPTLVPSPTSTPTKPTSTPTVGVKPSSTLVPTATIVSVTASSVSASTDTGTEISTTYTYRMLSPNDGELLNTSRSTFEWETNIVLKQGEYLELIVWPKSAGPQAWQDGRSPVGAKPAPRTMPLWVENIDLTKFAEQQPAFFSPGEYYWGVAVVVLNPQYKKLSLLGGGAQSFTYQPPNNAVAPPPSPADERPCIPGRDPGC